MSQYKYKCDVVLLLRAVGSAFIVVCAGYRSTEYKILGNVQVQGFMLGECRCAGTVLRPCYCV